MVTSRCIENYYHNGHKEPCTSGAKSYRIKAQLGSGCFGQVYAAVRKENGQALAIKRFLRDNKYQEKDGRRVSKEIAALQRLVGVPGVVQYYDHYSIGSHDFLVMEKPENSVQLQQFIDAYGLLPEKLVKTIFKQLVEAFMLSSERNVYHRDLKTENVLFSLKTGEVKLIDYGICTITEDSMMNTCKFGNHVHGCNPPEWGDAECIQPSKIMMWTLGRQLYTLLTNDQTLENDNMIYAKPWWPRHVSSGARRLAMKCLNVDPRRRPTFRALLYDPWLRTAECVPCNLESLMNAEKFLHASQRFGNCASLKKYDEWYQSIIEEEEE